ncbi:hypothetical protein LEP1GSC071_3829 [Leptospira santarosai str. JET]|uniref:Uncharacterized protein n=1 Tax=Leptospira santarosai serovar Shermani str. LT 821 TaxID=758847 RepID=K8Y2V4_9LEPT|nr:hypothetical protein LEP1GSC071_3829 [Leptospira santarosai str. JET]EKT87814.1 hypothetical protein LSS_05598 [Leptospira santarosai serovar Shermani str. LT 821]EPG84416.1 hypothetical protein LEP1GSC048_3410 [Leptospira santarosai serovar Shermani str. 1342KT]
MSKYVAYIPGYGFEGIENISKKKNIMKQKRELTAARKKKYKNR